MLAPLFLGLVLSVGQPVPAFLPWPAEAGPDPTVSVRPAATPVRRATATLKVEVVEEDMPSFPIPVRRAAAGTAELPAFAIPIRR